MRTRIDARSASAKETAAVLGVPKSRLKRLLALAKHFSALASENGNKASKEVRSQVRVKLNAAKPKNIIIRLKQKATKKSGASGKRHVRGKVAKITR
jgi:hypothetical protein